MKKLVLVLILLSLGLVVAPGQAAPDCLATPFGPGCHAGLPYVEYQLLLDDMLAQPQPQVKPLPLDTEEVYKYAFRSLNSGNVGLYAGPNGASLGAIPSGAKYVTTMAYEPGWVMVQPGQWVRESDTRIVEASTYRGVELGLDSLSPYTLAWVLLPEYPAPYPGAEGDRSRPRLERYTPVNIFAEALVDGWRWYLVGPEAWIKQTSMGKVVLSERPEGVKGPWIAGDLYEQVLVLYDENDRPIFATLMSSGRPDYDTRLGTFQTWLRMDADKMSGAAGQDDFYNVDFVPWVLYYDQDYAIHAVYWHDKFGYRASRGCLGLSLTDAKWLYTWTLDRGYEQPWIHVFSSGDYVGE